MLADLPNITYVCVIERRGQLLMLCGVRGRCVNVYGTAVECHSQRNTKVLGENSVPMPICAPQILTCIGLEVKRGLRGWTPTTKLLSHAGALTYC